MQWLRASTERRRWCSRGRRRRMTRRGGDWGTVAVRTTGTAASASGVGKRRAARIRGRGAEAEGVSGVSGREARGSGGRWRPYPLAGFTAGEGVRRRRALFRPRRGNRKGTRGEVGWAGARLRVAAQLGPGGRFWAAGPVGGERALFPLLSFSVLFSVFSYLFISFSVLFHLKVFRHFIKMCFLHHSYQCII